MADHSSSTSISTSRAPSWPLRRARGTHFPSTLVALLGRRHSQQQRLLNNGTRPLGAGELDEVEKIVICGGAPVVGARLLCGYVTGAGRAGTMRHDGGKEMRGVAFAASRMPLLPLFGAMSMAMPCMAVCPPAAYTLHTQPCRPLCAPHTSPSFFIQTARTLIAGRAHALTRGLSRPHLACFRLADAVACGSRASRP